MAAMLEVNDINVYYGAIHAIKGISFEVNEGEVVTLIGANGAGKSTTLKTISGLLHSTTGGRGGGGAVLTAEGAELLAAYDACDRELKEEARRLFCRYFSDFTGLKSGNPPGKL